jgi:hypothetical protein
MDIQFGNTAQTIENAEDNEGGFGTSSTGPSSCMQVTELSTLNRHPAFAESPPSEPDLVR